MHHRCAINILIAKKNLKLPLNRNLCSVSDQNYIKPIGECFILSLQTTGHQKSTICFEHTQHMLSKYQTLSRLLPIRNFSSTKSVFSLKGSNKDKEDRQVLILTVSLVSALLLCIFAMATMEYHQDYVKIEPENTK